MDPSNDITLRTETTSASYQEDELLKEVEEEMNRILELRIERDQLIIELADSHTKIKTLLSEITSLRQLGIFYKLVEPCFREHQAASQAQHCENEDVSLKNTKHETEDAGKAIGL